MSWAGALLAGGAVAAVAGAYLAGEQAGQDAERARHVDQQQLVAQAGEAAASAAARAIASIKVRHTTIRQEAEREIQTRVEYRDCRHGPEQLQRIDAALTGAAGPQPAGGGQLP